MKPIFTPGELYHRRTDIHKKYKGQERGGIITPAGHKLILLVTGASGRQHGYEDQWTDGGSTFLYYGEGQLGDMQFTKRNLAIRDHLLNGKDIHLFEAVRGKKGWLKYLGEMVCAGYEWVRAPDSKKHERNAVRFRLMPRDAFAGAFGGEPVDAEEDAELCNDTLSELRQNALADSAEARTPVQRKASYRRRSRAIRLYVLRRAAGKCEGCAAPAPFTTTAGDPYLLKQANCKC